MIRINLLPFRLARKKENVRKQVSVFLLSIVFIALLLVLLSNAMNKKITHIENQIASVTAETANYKKQADRVTKLKRDLKTLGEKLEVVENLKSRKNEQQLLLESLADNIVRTRMWLTKVLVDDQKNTVAIEGIAFDNPTIASFMRNLESIGMFGAVDLKLSKIKTIDEIRLKEFKISCNKKLPESEGNETGKNGKSPGKGK